MLKIRNVEIECYVLLGCGMQQAIGLKGEAKTHGGKLKDFLSLEAIKPFVTSDLTMALETLQDTTDGCV